MGEGAGDHAKVTRQEKGIVSEGEAKDCGSVGGRMPFVAYYRGGSREGVGESGRESDSLG